MNNRQRDLARHALGLPNAKRISYRNGFTVSPNGVNHRDWLAMVRAGYAWRREPENGLYDLFWLTRAGAELAIEPDERLCPEDFPPIVRVSA